MTERLPREALERRSEQRGPREPLEVPRLNRVSAPPAAATVAAAAVRLAGETNPLVHPVSRSGGPRLGRGREIIRPRRPRQRGGGEGSHRCRRRDRRRNGREPIQVAFLKAAAGRARWSAIAAAAGFLAVGMGRGGRCARRAAFGVAAAAAVVVVVVVEGLVAVLTHVSGACLGRDRSRNFCGCALLLATYDGYLIFGLFGNAFRVSCII